MSNVITAIRSCDSDLLRDMLASGADPNAIDDESGESVLAIAAQLGNQEAVEQLLAAGADPNALGTIFWPLEAAAGAGHPEIVERLLFADADIDAEDEDGATALGSAAAGGHLEIVKMLIEAGANPKHKDRDGNVPATYAINNGHDTVAEFLLPYSPPKIRRRLELQKEFNAQEIPPETVDTFIEAALRGKTSEVRAMLQSGINVDVLGSDEGTTALMWAANKGHLETVELLLDHGANPNHTDEYEETALAMAAKGGQAKVYEYLYPLTAAKHRPRAERYKGVIISRKQWKE